MTEKERAEERKKTEVWERGGRDEGERTVRRKKKKSKKQETYGEKLSTVVQCVWKRERAKERMRARKTETSLWTHTHTHNRNSCLQIQREICCISIHPLEPFRHFVGLQPGLNWDYVINLLKNTLILKNIDLVCTTITNSSHKSCDCISITPCYCEII